ncbi:DNA polymerase [Fodinibius roseus]|uniref:Type-4 uracil-DNA glycosylase n=1 Tax=Fodinibius roseus TaxID=1194090 RepID=A0A1M4SLU3_9BACT|nr:uracil-DNA glycosylase family protein [Fodinibius roseus]SHE33132.1 DNA polymerase [Fodinibius roseus]
MADSNLTPDKLIDNIISYIRNERDLYGDFTMRQETAGQPDSRDKDLTQQDNEMAPESSSQPQKQPNAAGTGDDASQAPKQQPASGARDSASSDGDDNIYQHIEQCQTLEELEALCRKADMLRTDLNDTQLVFGVGNPHADLMIIGEAPGAEEDRQGEPFVGKAGQLLNKILHSINFTRDEVYIANILKHRPPNNRNPNAEERERSLPFLLRQIDLINPKLILSLGKVSSQTLLDKNVSLSRMRGKFHNFRGNYELLATYHPAALLRHPKWKRPTWEDVQLLRKRYDELGCEP